MLNSSSGSDGIYGKFCGFHLNHLSEQNEEYKVMKADWLLADPGDCVQLWAIRNHLPGLTCTIHYWRLGYLVRVYAPVDFLSPLSRTSFMESAKSHCQTSHQTVRCSKDKYQRRATNFQFWSKMGSNLKIEHCCHPLDSKANRKLPYPNQMQILRCSEVLSSTIINE